MKRNLLLCASILALASSPAVCADLPSTKAPAIAPVPVFTWNGFYAGAFGGGAWGASSVSQPGFESANSNLSGGTFGAVAGYNIQINQLLVGAEADGGWLGLSGEGRFADLSSGLPYNQSFDSDFVARIRGRVGYAIGDALIFASGGLSLSSGRVGLTDIGSSSAYGIQNSLIGTNIGAGVDYALGADWVGRLEYIHDQYGSSGYAFSTLPSGVVAFNDRTGKYQDNIVRAGLIYNFGGALPNNGVDDAKPWAPPADPNYTTAALNNLGDSFFARLYNYYVLEWGHDGAPVDPAAPASRRADWTPAPETSPPMPFAEYSYGGSTSLGVNRTGSVDSPLMVALSNTSIGQWMNNNGIQVYGWANAGGNVSSNTLHDGGNAPAAYMYSPNTVTLDQAVVYVERTPDTVQKDHIDWGFRFSAIYGENYRYTTSYGLASYQYLNHNNVNGYDFPMVYGELYFPQVAEGMLVRFGRYISLPDIEAQLAPNNYMYSHSMTYAYDNYTNNGIQATIAINKNLFIQPGVTIGSDTAIWNWGAHVTNQLPGNPLYPGATFLKDPGAVPSATLCVRYQTDSAADNIYLCGDALNRGQWGYNNLQWIGGTYYHKFNDQWHLAFESYNVHETNVPNNQNPRVSSIVSGGGTPFSPQYIPFNAPGTANCHNTTQLTCNATVQTFLIYVNYQPTTRDNISFRTEYFDDMNGQRTGVATSYAEWALGWQHWLSPQIEVRPEIAYYRSFQADAFNGNSNFGIAPTRNYAVIGSGDIIFHF